MRQRRDVEVDDLELAVEIRFVKVAVRADTGVVHERDNTVVDGPQSGREMLAVEPSCEIRWERGTGDAVPIGERSAERLERFASTRDEDEVVSVARVQLGEVTTDSTRCASDYRDGTAVTAARGGGNRCWDCGHGRLA